MNGNHGLKNRRRVPSASVISKMSKLQATVQNGELIFSSPLTRERFFASAEGKEVRLTIHEEPSRNLKKFFEGSIVPAFFYWHPNSGWADFKEAREALKLEFAPGIRKITLRDGSKARVAPSMASLSRASYQMMVDSVVAWFIEQGMAPEVIDSELYLKWRDSQFDEPYYPPLRRLKERYEHEKTI